MFKFNPHFKKTLHAPAIHRWFQNVLRLFPHMYVEHKATHRVVYVSFVTTRHIVIRCVVEAAQANLMHPE